MELMISMGKWAGDMGGEGGYDRLTCTTSWTFCCVKFGGKVTLPGTILGAGWREAMVTR